MEERGAMHTEIYRFTLGAFKCMCIMDTTVESEAGRLFANAPEQALAQACRKHNIQQGRAVFPVVCLVADAGGHRILLDTGCGTSADPEPGRLLQGLRAQGIDPSDIDWVLLSHWHWDHTGGNIDEERRPAFPKAYYVMWKQEWDWLASASELERVDEAEAARIRHEFLALEDRILLVKRDAEILPGVEAIAAPGHSVGHMAVMLFSEGRRLLCIGDAAAHPIHLEHPDWYMAFDAAPEEALVTRRRLLARSAAEDSLVFGPHFPFPGIGHVIDRGGYWQWQPMGA
jgi:glyoxylase-like metal-dependent hydrolase (beta-lactamase superfamily II)